MLQRCVREADRLQRCVTKICHRGATEVSQRNVVDMSQMEGHKDVAQRHHRGVDVSQ